MALSAFQRLARKLKMTGSRRDLLRQALTHKSYLGEFEEALTNERLEFLGDAILGVVVAEELFRLFPDKQEGSLAKAKAVVVSEAVLARVAKDMGLQDAIFLGLGEETCGGRNRPSILSDAFEAVVAAVYLTQGLGEARALILKTLGPILEDVEREEYRRDYKSELQERCQSVFKRPPEYMVVRELGAAHDKTFEVEVRLGDRVLGRGVGKSKKQAEQAAAREALACSDFIFEQRCCYEHEKGVIWRGERLNHE